MQTLVEQARAFRDRVREQRDEFRRLAAGQSPQALFITCSDSRVIPALITQAKPGELFELRNAGHIVPPYHPARISGEAATIEYAVEVLGVRDVVVCGHSHCGAVGALARVENLDRLPAVRRWLAAAHPGRTRSGGVRSGGDQGVSPYAASDDPALRDAVQRHVLAQLDKLRRYPQVARRHACGLLRLHGWFYEVDTGAVWEHREGTWRPL
ncbi:carbonic anhydrase [Carbonactinospora thermoautotrophica]|uniref:carbonic anhydrase n=1 Tax=Carbonactinospora thermoautotrophica TaxID=1469144 RepID=UPI00226E7231|nr:carbonic anhydrase [Carbonactinospora thermoautotrophica]MCX9192463.1 carbonic anhydrase [Carbonactinospora thermoautotrophica]